ncbi:MAG TPA: response regulator [Sphingobium sp.]
MSNTMPTALIVEDEALLRSVYGSHLSDLGYAVQEAAHADAALEILATSPPFDLLLTDIRTGGSIDGVELSHRVARTTGATRIVLMSGDESDQEIGTGMSFLLKPFTLSALLSLLDVTD